MMGDIVGLCDICGRPGSMYTCQLCGRSVCERCYEHRHFLCIECKHLKRRSESPSHPID
ncbi:MAG: orotate phosphoribosyltransferase [Candidatus Thermoplasmatota archaeon]|nr:orotate phosphoribosyltransferase [Candidatus Thermoplasmatota archaeon]